MQNHYRMLLSGILVREYDKEKTQKQPIWRWGHRDLVSHFFFKKRSVFLRQKMSQSTSLCERDLLCAQLSDTLTLVNKYEARVGYTYFLESILNAIVDHYESQKNSSSMNLTCRFYVYAGSRIHAEFPEEDEELLYSLWLDEITSTGVTIGGVEYMLCLHPDQVYDGKPLPLLVSKASRSETPLTIKERTVHRTHSHLLNNYPAFTGWLVDTTLISSWVSNANLSATNTVVLPKNDLLERLCSVWLGRPVLSPSVSTLIADSACIKEFVSNVLLHSDSRCHFQLSGELTLYAYLVVTANDGLQTDIARLAIGTTTI